MKIKTVCQRTQLTDRAIRYYIEEELIAPSYTENYLGRKTFDFSEDDVKALQDIAVLRKFGFTIEEIKLLIANTANSPAILSDVRIRKQQTINEEQAALNALAFLDTERAYTVSEIAEVLKAPVSERVLPREDSKFNFWKVLWSVFKNTVITAIAVLPVLIVLFVTIEELHFYKYPTTGIASFFWLILALLPSISLFFMYKLKRKKTEKRTKPKIIAKKIAKAIVLLLCICYLPFTLLFAGGIFGHSETTDIRNYRKLDSECLANRSLFFQKLFPTWPHYFTVDENFETVYLDAHYYYRYLEFMDSTYDVYAEWPLEREAFDQEVARVKALFEDYREDGYYPKYVEMQKGAYNCLIFCSVCSVDMLFEPVTDSYDYYIFAYDEENLRVRYIACYSLENGVDQPYYLELDW